MTNEKFIEALQIFSKYEGYQEIAAEHDIIFAGPDPDVVSKEDREKLDSLGWHESEYGGCFSTYV